MHAPLLISTMAILEPMANRGQQRIERAHDLALTLRSRRSASSCCTHFGGSSFFVEIRYILYNIAFRLASSQRCPANRENDMKLSARNQLKGKIVDVIKGATTSHVQVDIGQGIIVTSAITNEAVADLGLKKGDEAWAIIKASDVMIGK
jgi:molybdopterin-binding protein